MGKKEKMYTIGELSKLTDISITTLRYYDQEAVLIPEIRNEETGYRYYSEKQLAQAQAIKDLKPYGLSLDDIRNVLKQQNVEYLGQRLLTRIHEIEAEIQMLNNRLTSTQYAYRRIIGGRSIIDSVAGMPKMMSKDFYPVEVAPLPETWVIYTRKACKLNADELFSDRCLELQRIRDKYQLFPIGSYIGVFHDGYKSQFEAEEGDLEVCLPIIKPDGFSCDEIKHFGGILTASTLHVGPYGTMRSTYETLLAWIEDSHYEVDGPPVEYYMMDLGNTFDENYYITKVNFPVRHKGR